MDPVSDPAKLKAEATYNAAADHFDDGPLAFWDRYGRLTVQRLSLAPGSAVLDVGCGSGASAIPAAIDVGPQGRVIGIDLAERLLTIARSKSLAQHLHNVEFRRADMTALSYPDASFDAVISVFSLFFVADMVAEIRELWRVLRPGGKLAITTWGPRMFEPGSEAFWSAVKEFRPDLVATVSPWERITRPDALRQLLSESGIRGAEVTSEDGKQRLQSVEDWWTIVLGSGYRWTVEQMSEGERAGVKAANLKKLRESGTTSVETNVICAIAPKI
ncbi:ubiquinone biosynthesis protein UbiE [Bradyrhizobium sp. CCBAU 51745]|uniref:class I SAM-dependent methyltransferase n=1 Tax=Bradyrhizobium sp. CCBAU 51745 TaxID=1325099 RepID=UPI0023060B83|nr:methyltransferase domain-containing protein [Bradyrhizobium sp. CCBAU 51745]MDA9438431.1 ubiquinone biosynthesis protein UbiE [Bradyrhizobium sp. CCBAU 51745]